MVNWRINNSGTGMKKVMLSGGGGVMICNDKRIVRIGADCYLLLRSIYNARFTPKKVLLSTKNTCFGGLNVE